MLKHIIPDTHSTVTPAQLVQSGRVTIAVQNNETAQELEKSVTTSARRRRDAKDRDLKKKIKLICEKELNSTFSESTTTKILDKEKKQTC